MDSVPKRNQVPETQTKQTRAIPIPHTQDETLLEKILTPDVIIVEPATKRRCVNSGASDLSAEKELMKMYVLFLYCMFYRVFFFCF